MSNKITNVEEAKRYIEYFNRYVACPVPITFVDTNYGERIVLSNMTVKETLFVANGLKEIEIRASQNYIGVKH